MNKKGTKICVYAHNLKSIDFVRKYYGNKINNNFVADELKNLNELNLFERKNLWEIKI